MGQLRENELAEVAANTHSAGVKVAVSDVSSLFLERLQEPLGEGEISEAKRAVFSSAYAEEFARQANRVNAKFALQMSLAPDFIESGKEGGSALIKSHHNVSAVFERELKKHGITPLHPFRHLFKYEVRALAAELGLPSRVVNRQPFPGPGLLVRWVGGIPTRKNLELVRWADARVREALTATGEYDKISQLVVAIPALRITGVKGDSRAYGYPVWIRAVESADYMTARGYRLPAETQEKLEQALTVHSEIVGVSYWPTSKPPETVEFE